MDDTQVMSKDSEDFVTLDDFLLSLKTKRRIAFHTLPYNNWYMLTHPWEYVFWLRDEMRWFIHRGLYGYSDYDTWALNDYLLKWLPSALRDMAKEAHGHPTYLSSVEEWRGILRGMADGLESGQDYWDKHERRVPEEFMAAMDNMRDFFWSLWD